MAPYMYVASTFFHHMSKNKIKMYIFGWYVGDIDMARDRKMIDKTSPYNDLPLLPPAVELETKAVLKQAIKANASLARLEGLAKLLPHQGALIDSIVLEEAKDSSEIESIFTTQDELYRASAGGIAAASAATKEVMRYREAL